MVGRAGGAGAVYQAMSGMGLLATPRNEPLRLHRTSANQSVLILGAGLAGMSAAYELGKLGYKCKILEARGRAGGRCHTIRGGTAETEIDGQRQVGAFDDGLYFNPGPTRVPSNHHSTIDYLREFKVPVELFCNANENAWYHSDKPENQALGGGRVRHRDAKPTSSPKHSSSDCTRSSATERSSRRSDTRAIARESCIAMRRA